MVPVVPSHPGPCSRLSAKSQLDIFQGAMLQKLNAKCLLLTYSTLDNGHVYTTVDIFVFTSFTVYRAIIL